MRFSARPMWGLRQHDSLKAGCCACRLKPAPARRMRTSQATSYHGIVFHPGPPAHLPHPPHADTALTPRSARGVAPAFLPACLPAGVDVAAALGSASGETSPGGFLVFVFVARHVSGPQQDAVVWAMATMHHFISHHVKASKVCARARVRGGGMFVWVRWGGRAACLFWFGALGRHVKAVQAAATTSA